MKRKSYTRRRSNRRHNQSRLAWVAGIIGLPTIVIGAGIMPLKSHMAEVPINPDTYCYPQENQFKSAFFIDYSFTDDNSTQQDIDLEIALQRAYNQLPPNGKLHIFSTARGISSSLTRPVLVQCRPATNPIEQASIPAAENTRSYLKRQANIAYQAYQTAAKQLMADAKDQSKIAKDSPILEQIQGISRYFPSGQLKQFHLYTDGVQNSEIRQFCLTKGHLPPFQTFKLSSDYQVIKPERLTGMVVNFLLIEQRQYPTTGAPYCTNDELRTFWPDFFNAHGASIQVSRLRYGAS